MVLYEGGLRMKAHVICMNDSVRYVVLEAEDKAEIKMEDLKEMYWQEHEGFFSRSYEAYKSRCYWHIHTVEAE